MLSALSHPILLGGDFNFTLHPIDSTGETTPSRALEEIIRGLALTDKWSQDPQRPTFTHYSPTGATRIDRIYLTKADINRKIVMEIIPNAFTDHNAVVLRLTTPAQEMMKTRGRWKMDPNLAQDENIHAKIKLEWAKWRKHKGSMVGTSSQATYRATRKKRRIRTQQETQYRGKSPISMPVLYHTKSRKGH
jgi:hypothetical protein